MKTLTTKIVRGFCGPLLFIALLSISCGALAQVQMHSDQSELQLIQAIKQIRAMKIDQAIDTLHAILTNKPRFKLAQLIYADLLESKTHAINHVGQPFNPKQEQLTELLEEAQVRWKHYSQHMAGNLVPRYLLKLNKDIKNVIIVDTSQSRLLLYKNDNGMPRLLYDLYASIGKNGVGKLKEGDKKTPIGVYFVSRFLAPNNLPDDYGDGAFPLNYPNSWDKFRGRSGSGIWLHGNPLGTFSRPPLDSDGCVTVSNDDLEKLKPYISVDQKTPVIITNKIEWVSVNDIQRRKKDFLAKLMQWKKDWESMNRQKYLSHYSREFDAGGKDFSQWSHEVAFNKSKKPVNIAINDISIFQYPGKDKVTIITFEQTFTTKQHKETERKRLYLKKEQDAVWRIFYEGSV